jgi:hypothetical protein
MPNKCVLCNTGKPDIQCHGCKRYGCYICVDLCCVECCVSMCAECIGSDEVLCGCYGVCGVCEKNVDRGIDGWLCSDCERWLCMQCRYKEQNECTSCRLYGEYQDEEVF